MLQIGKAAHMEAGATAAEAKQQLQAETLKVAELKTEVENVQKDVQVSVTDNLKMLISSLCLTSCKAGGAQ